MISGFYRKGSGETAKLLLSLQNGKMEMLPFYCVFVLPCTDRSQLDPIVNYFQFTLEMLNIANVVKNVRLHLEKV